MKPLDQMTESDARQRLDIIGDYLETLLRNAWDDLDTVGLLGHGKATGQSVTANDAMTAISMAQDLVQEMQAIGTRPWSVRSPSARTA